jgi:gliding motility-associated-like protein
MVEWRTTGGGTFNDVNITHPVYMPNQDDVDNGFVQLILTGVSNSTCENVKDTVDVQIEKQTVIDAGEDIMICGLQDIALANVSVTNQNGEINWTTSGSGKFSDQHLINTTYTPSEADLINGNVILTVTHRSTGVCGMVFDEVILTISEKPEGNAGPVINTCFGEPVTIENNYAENYSSINWSTSGNGILENTNSISPTYYPADGETGTVQLFMQIIGENACGNDTIYSETELLIYEQLIIDAGADDTIFTNTSSLLSVDIENGSGNYFYSWEPKDLVLDPNSNSTETIELFSDVGFEIFVRDAETGCTATDFVTVYVEDETDKLVGFYNGFTPNNDGVNDTWFIEGIEKFPNNEVMIFNRWGDKIIELRNYDNKNIVWNGTNQRGAKVSDGTYYYIVTLNNDTSYTGWIHLRSER